uniref:hypothetical protein n=1 Tax=Mycobacterium marinum TaxID=1781 RepID=UPI001CA4782C
AQRMASRPKAPAPVATAESHVVTDAEAGSMGIMAEYMANNHDEPGITEVAEQLMACVETRDAKSGATADALKAIRADASKDSKYEAGRYLGLASDDMISVHSSFIDNVVEENPREGRVDVTTTILVGRSLSTSLSPGWRDVRDNSVVDLKVLGLLTIPVEGHLDVEIPLGDLIA